MQFSLLRQASIFTILDYDLDIGAEPETPGVSKDHLSDASKRKKYAQIFVFGVQISKHPW